MYKKKVMIIDDSEDFLKMTKLNLEETGQYEALTLSRVEDLKSLLNIF